ncbi:GNAT family N-acetyltransferase [Acerihabitans arboris]|uniref:GNAT family N-acetyltransferase n=1 Tax=Acerihabitans arboris TaxID=2691583 RepID=A0A845SGQ9_9GAMM|nr:GNAT family N-acetyltransferase [Acerihabitans arboris]NDL61878.1 GNAT family N-acetyltransferase [Acerihabitans arboris]
MTDYRELISPPSLKLSLQLESDAPAIFNLVREERERLGRHLSWPPLINEVGDTLANIRHNRADFAEGRSAVYVVRWDDAIAGILSFNTINDKQAEIGYWLAARFEGRGVMSRAVTALMAWYGDTGKLDQFIIRCGVANRPSNRLAQRLGFVFDYCQVRAEKIGDRYVDHNVYCRQYKKRQA